MKWPGDQPPKLSPGDFATFQYEGSFHAWSFHAFPSEIFKVIRREWGISYRGLGWHYQLQSLDDGMFVNYREFNLVRFQGIQLVL